MTPGPDALGRLERLLGRVLLTGVAISAAALAAGIAGLLLWPGSGTADLLLLAGLGVLTATPMLRVVVSIVEYVRMGELAFAGVTVLVLAELAVGVGYALWKG